MDLTDSFFGSRTIRRSLEKNCTTSSEESIQLRIDNECNSTLAKCGDDQCPVCLEKDVNTMLLPCSHTFHGDCILQWVQNNFSCPLCRTEISHFVPMKGQHKSELQRRFVKVWEKHYLEKSDEAEENPDDGKIQKSVLASRNQPTAMVRTKSVVRFTPVEEPCYQTNCSHCRNCCMVNAFIYLAFDQKFCSTQCRLQYARKNPPSLGVENAGGTNSFYVDYEQVEKYVHAS